MLHKTLQLFSLEELKELIHLIEERIKQMITAEKTRGTIIWRRTSRTKTKTKTLYKTNIFKMSQMLRVVGKKSLQEHKGPT